jgi:hypothetical protein
LWLILSMIFDRYSDSLLANNQQHIPNATDKAKCTQWWTWPLWPSIWPYDPVLRVIFLFLVQDESCYWLHVTGEKKQYLHLTFHEKSFVFNLVQPAKLCLVTKCYRILQNVTECCRKSEYYKMLHNVAECYKMLQNVT